MVKSSISNFHQKGLFIFLLTSFLVINYLVLGCVTLAKHANPESLPLFDAHAHLNHDMTAEMLIKWMDQAGVRKMVLMPRYYSDDGKATDWQAAEYVRRYPERFIAFIAGQRGDLWRLTAWMTEGAPDIRGDKRQWLMSSGHRFLEEAESKLRSGQYRGLGEFIIHHYGYNRLVPTTNQSVSGDVELPVDTPLMFKIVDLAARYNVPVLIHAEAEPQTTEQMRKLLDRSPKTKIIWAHNCGRGPAEQTAEFLKTYPNLMCDLGCMSNASYGYGTGWPAGRSRHITVVQYGDGRINSKMRNLFETFPDRFIIGTDIAHPHIYSRYSDAIVSFRLLLSQLTPETARMIGYVNAERLFERTQTDVGRTKVTD
jgi:predicted TIM-barrel fold metal-dependent hydrolase